MSNSTRSYETNKLWHLFGMLVLSIRFVQGWIFWGGGSRRFIYAPQKLDPKSASYMAYKLQAAMPGALLEVDKIINWLLQHYYLLFASIILFSIVELVSGIFLMAGFLTRISGLVTVFLSVSLMIIFGWQGETCMDEWTMAVGTCAMGLTLALTGASAYSVDAYILKKKPHLANKKWFKVIASGPLSERSLTKYAKLFLLFCLVFTLGTYDYYRGAIFSHYHHGPTDPRIHKVQLSDLIYHQGTITFNAYVDAGDSATPAHIMRLQLLNDKGKVLREWSDKRLSSFPVTNFKNVFAYNKILPGKFGLDGYLGAKATITLPEKVVLFKGHYKLSLETINGHYTSIKFIV